MALDLEALNGTSDSEYTYTTAEEAVETTMGEFFDLLMAQITNQDPLNPMEDTEFVAQLAQFQALEEAQETNKAVQDLTALQKIAQANTLLGDYITAINTSDGTEIAGIVTKVTITDNVPTLVLDTEDEVALENILSVEPVYIVDSSDSGSES